LIHDSLSKGATMPIEKRRLGDIHVISPSGDVTIGGGRLGTFLDARGLPLDDVGSEIRKLLDGGHARLLLDLAAVRFIDSAGLGELIALKKRALENGGDLKILRPSSRVLELLRMVRLTDIFDVVTDESDAASTF
jgi:anti-anti-sigma factor